jgi:hypothetical protein
MGISGSLAWLVFESKINPLRNYEAYTGFLFQHEQGAREIYARFKRRHCPIANFAPNNSITQ